MPADVEQEVAVADGAADAADIDGVTLDDHHVAAGLGQQIAGRQARRAGADDKRLGIQ